MTDGPGGGGRGGGEGEVAVVGLARSGRAAAELLARHGARVYASDSGDTPEIAANVEELRGMGVDAVAGSHDVRRIASASRVVVSPGIPPTAPPIAAARAAGREIVSEVTIALEFLPGTRVIAVTGTNGKSTTTALIGHILKERGEDAEAAGNIGRPVSELALLEAAPRWLALELSSFQLHDITGLRPAVGVLTNVSPDHLDRYDSVDDYYGDKRRLFDGAGPDSRWVVNADDRTAIGLASGAEGKHFLFSLGAAADASLDGEQLTLMGETLMRRRDLPLLGAHNVANALAAALAVAVADEEHQTSDARAAIARALASFDGLPHRLERVVEKSGVLWINDSKATNVASARVAIEAMTRPTVLLLGGRHKGEPYAGLRSAVAEKCRAVIAFGEARERIVRELEGATVIESAAPDLKQVIRRAASLARPGDAVLLAPACSSYDMFRDYEERGDTFKSVVRSL